MFAVLDHHEVGTLVVSLHQDLEEAEAAAVAFFAEFTECQLTELAICWMATLDYSGEVQTTVEERYLLGLTPWTQQVFHEENKIIVFSSLSQQHAVEVATNEYESLED